MKRLFIFFPMTDWSLSIIIFLAAGCINVNINVNMFESKRKHRSHNLYRGTPPHTSEFV